MKPGFRAAAIALATVVSLLVAPARAAPVIEGMSKEQGAALLERMTSRIHQFIPGKLADEEIEFIGPAPLGNGFYVVSARQGRLVAITDERVNNIMLLGGYVNITDGKKIDVLAGVREKVGYVPPRPAASANPPNRVELHPAEAIPMYNGDRVVHVICDPNLAECRRFQNDVLKRTTNVRAYIYPVGLVEPGNWREHSVRELLCWPLQLQFPQWDAIVNGSTPAAAGAPGQHCARNQQFDDLTERLKKSSNMKPLPIIMMPDGSTVSGAGMSPDQFERLLAGR